jgi:glycosyltransferase involved in cell wall biosynthesis
VRAEPLRIACIGARGLPAVYGGLERACESLYSGLAARGHEITVYCRSEYVQRRGQRHHGVALQYAPAIRTRTLDTLTHTACSFAHVLASNRYDLVHLHALAPNVFSRWCRLRRIPIVATVHGLDWQRAKWRGLGSRVLKFAERSMVANADSIIVVSRALRDYFSATYGRETHYIPTGIEARPAAEPVDDTVLRERGLVPGQYVLFVGRLVPEKRIQDLIAAFRPLAAPLRLVIAGGSSYSDGYARGLRRLASNDSRVIFTGLQSHAAVRALFRHAAVFVNPSELEGLPATVFESIAEGTPAVVSDIPPHREMLAAGSGYDLFFAAGDTDGLCRALRRALANPDHYRRLTVAAAKQAESEYSWPSIIERTESLLHGVLRNSIRAATAAREQMT